MNVPARASRPERHVRRSSLDDRPSTFSRPRAATIVRPTSVAEGAAIQRSTFIVDRSTFLRLALLLLWPAAAPAGAAEVDFVRDVRPILAEHCFKCHGAAVRENGLRLDAREAAVEKLESGATAIVPGKPEASELVRRTSSHDPDVVMPPPSAKKPLTPQRIKTLERWIAEGAPYAVHWAFVPPLPPAVPKVSVAGTEIKSPIDAFVAERLNREGLSMSPPAPPDVLCRRIYLDVIGLPPSPREVDEFVAAAKRDRPAAIEALLDRLLSSPHYGEKWARHWLDAARYADSNGYEKDLPREQWAWRDWVIDAFNRDLPYDQFIIQQVAGDLLENVEGSTLLVPGTASPPVVATGFLANGMINEEGAIIPEEFRMEAMFDRMDCLGKAVLGLSVQCAQCHTHKFDPIAQTEYYGMFAFLNNTYEAQSWVYSQPQLDKIAAVRAGLARNDARVREQIPDWQQRLAPWEAGELGRHDAFHWQVVEAVDLHSSTELNHPVSLADNSILTLGHKTIVGDVYMIAEPKRTGATALRLEILRHGDLPFEGPGRSFKGTWALTELVVESQRPGDMKWERLKLASATADFAEPEHKLEPEWENKSKDKDTKRTCGPAAFLVDGSDDTAWRADRGPGRRNTDSVAVAQFERPLDLPEGTKLKISLRTNHGGDDNGVKNVMVGRFRVSLTTSPDAKVDGTPYAAILAMRTPPEKRTPRQQTEIFAAWRASVPELAALNAEAESLWSQYPEAMTSVLHLAERRDEYVRPTHRLERGAWNRPQEHIAPHVPAVFHPLTAAQAAAPASPSTEGAVGRSPSPNSVPASTRLDFARWLADRRSPLAARVAVNRVWQAMFGMGLVETPEDFGTRAPLPEHPALLDWLAVEFMDRGWSHKQLIRTIVASATYQQRSSLNPQLLDRDPRNLLLARGPRFRVEAEVVRDVALGVSGLLHPKVGGPSIFPPVPQTVLDYNFFKPTYWVPATGPERYRRALYVFRKRSMPDPVLMSFDAPNADFSCARRPRSNTPLAALVSLNEPIFVEASRALALRILKEGGPTDAERVDYAYRLCTSRLPKPAEKEAVLEMLAAHRRRIADGWLSPREITTGDASKLPELPPNTTPQDAAAWMLVARVLLNLDETLSKN
ncbi:MAG: PSD1 domain-containing protein [Planctomycetia bacterium]|nr:PSD1 domain-containing protein [Planctomycetia bacterium]